MSPKLLALLALPLPIVRTVHAASPSLWVATGMWLFVAVMVVAWIRLMRRAAVPVHGAWLVAAGALCNGLVMLVNGGYMPVIGLDPARDSSVWRSADQGGHLLFLADRMAWGGASPGDFLIAGGTLFTVGVLLARGARALGRRLQPAFS